MYFGDANAINFLFYINSSVYSSATGCHEGSQKFRKLKRFREEYFEVLKKSLS